MWPAEQEEEEEEERFCVGDLDKVSPELYKACGAASKGDTPLRYQPPSLCYQQKILTCWSLDINMTPNSTWSILHVMSYGFHMDLTLKHSYCALWLMDYYAYNDNWTWKSRKIGNVTRKVFQAHRNNNNIFKGTIIVSETGLSEVNWIIQLLGRAKSWEQAYFMRIHPLGCNPGEMCWNVEFWLMVNRK